MADDIPSGEIGTLVDHLFTGGASDAVIAILMLVVVALGFSIWQLYKRLLEAEKERVAQSTGHQDDLRSLNKEYQQVVKDITTEYKDTLKQLNADNQTFVRGIIAENNESADEIAKALQSVQVTISEMKTVVSFTSARGQNHGTP